MSQSLPALRGNSNVAKSVIRPTMASNIDKELNSMQKVSTYLSKAHNAYSMGQYTVALQYCDAAYELDAYRTDNLLLLAATHFQLRNYSESVFFNQQCIRVDSNFAEAYSNLGNALKELGDIDASVQFYLKAIKLKPRYCDAYNNLASAYVQLGRTNEAMETFSLAISINPGLVDAHSNLGNLLKATGDYSAAKKCYLEAIRLKPDFAIAWNNLAGIFKDEGELDTAIAYYKEAIRLIPDFADAHSNLGNAYRSQNNAGAALDCYKVAVRLRPDFAIARGNLAACLFDLGDIPAAVREFKQAIQLDSNYPDAHNNLGNAYQRLGQLNYAIDCYRECLRLKPDHPYAYNNLGNALKDKCLFKEAIHCYVTAIRLLPSFAPAHCNLASIFKDQGKVSQAIAHYTEALTIDPQFADAHSNLGNVYKEMGRISEAMECYQRALSIRPSFAEACTNLGATFKDQNQILEAMHCYERVLSMNPEQSDASAGLIHCRLLLCDWTSYESDISKIKSLVSSSNTVKSPKQEAADNCHATPSSSMTQKGLKNAGITPPILQPFHALAFPLSLAELANIAERYAHKIRMNVSLAINEGGSLFIHHSSIKSKYTRIRIGYVSSDFGNHPIGYQMQSVFGYHDRERFEVTCYSLSPSDGSVWRDRIEQNSENFKDISNLSFTEAAQTIYQDGIHILVNLNGYTKGARNEIFALRPAPIQIAMQGFSGSMGADFIEYFLADATTIPSDHRHGYKEKILYMPHSHVVNDHRQSSRSVVDKVDMPSRADFGISEDAFVFCNFNQPYKIDPETFQSWMRILKRVPNSMLWLLRYPGYEEAEVNLRSIARDQGVEQQLVYSDATKKEDHIKRGFLADLFIDSPSYNANSTACDILWSGTPIITMPGHKMVSRVSASLLAPLGLTDLIVSTYSEYEELAVSLALDPERLYRYRLHVESNRDKCAVFDTKRWVRNLETGLTAVWKRFEGGQSPDHVLVEDHEPSFEVPTDAIL